MFDDPRSDDSRDRDDWRDRDHDALDREHIDPRDVFADALNLPRGLEREYVRDRGHQYELRGSEVRTIGRRAGGSWGGLRDGGKTDANPER